MNRASPLPAPGVASQAADPTPVSSLLMRKCACGQNAAGSCEECKEKEKKDEEVQRKPAGSGSAHDVPSIVQDVVSSSGQSLAADTRSHMERRFGHDFASVRIHTDSKAAQSARAVNAQAYTVGQHVVFDAGRFAPETPAGRHLLAHELAHTVQQRGAPARRQNRLTIHPAGTPEERAADRAADAVTSGGVVPQLSLPGAHGGLQRTENDDPRACDTDHTDAINAAAKTAGEWLGAVTKWFAAHRTLIDSRKPKYGEGGGFKRCGEALFSQLMLLDRHFKFSKIVREEPWRGRFPDSPDWEGQFKDYDTLARASYDIRRKFQDVHVSDLTSHCEKPCPANAEGADLVGSARAGSNQFTIYTNCFDKQEVDGKAGAVLHEAFHACFDKFTDDSYSHNKGYPGTDAVNNADSYATFASIVATGSSYRIQKVKETVIKASAEPEGP